MTQTQLSDKLTDILDIARLAPSVHNTQPWKVAVSADTMTISLDGPYVLKDGDPTGRQTTISCGIFAEAIAIAARRFGLIADDIFYKDSVATLIFSTAQNDPDTTDRLIDGLIKRSSDRSIYSPIAISEEHLSAIRTTALKNLTVFATSDTTVIATVADLTKKAIGVALSSPTFRAELAEYLVLPGSKKRRGISVKSLYTPTLQAILEPTLLRAGIGINAEAKLEYRRWASASGLAIITADGDMPPHWFMAGRSYLRTSIALQELGFSQATSAAVVEASNYHEDVEELLGTKQRILAVIRFGKGSPKRYYSPRVSVQELLTSS